jgi:hypothetical protein
LTRLVPNLNENVSDDIERMLTASSLPPGQKLNKLMLELTREVGYMSSSVLPDDKHLTEMAFRGNVALEAVLVSALFLADLTIPPEPLQPLRLHGIGQVLPISDAV